MFHAVYRLIELARNAFNNSESNRWKSLPSYEDCHNWVARQNVQWLA
jgi:hypothetical protein